MGVFIDLSISESVTQQEWETVYEETLFLLKSLPLAEIRTVNVHGVEALCLVKTEEHEFSHSIGWLAEGDLNSMKTCEGFFLPRNLTERFNRYEPDAPDAILNNIWKWNDERRGQIQRLWGGKTQGEPYHIYLLAIAALIEARLGGKACTGGDITRGQFVAAVAVANAFLDKPIDLPPRCDMVRLMRQIMTLPISCEEQIGAFVDLFLGTEDAEFGAFLREQMEDSELDAYWRSRFQGRSVENIGQDLRNYLLWGFPLNKLCHFIDFIDKDGNGQYGTFITKLLDTKLYLKEKDCADSFAIDKESPAPYGLGTVLAGVLFSRARNSKVDRFIPIEEIRTILQQEIGGQCDVHSLIDEYLATELKQAEDDLIKAETKRGPSQVLKNAVSNAEESGKDYNISSIAQLIDYKAGDTILPSLEDSLVVYIHALQSWLAHPDYARLKGKDAKTRCKWLGETNRYIIVKPEDWERVFANIESTPESFQRYYPLVLADLSSCKLCECMTALFLNDELYAYISRAVQAKQTEAGT